MNQSEHTNCRIAVDAMGGDFAPRNAVLGALMAAAENKNIDLYLVGRTSDIKKIISSGEFNITDDHIIQADEVIGMGESPANSIKAKPDSSIVRGANLVKEKKADAFVSAGNTGAMMTASTLIMGRIPGVGRPTIGAEMPSIGRICYFYDVGASKDSKPQHLLEYAVMGSIFAKEMGGVENPSIGLLSMGEEESKGNELTLAAYKLLKESDLNFIGNVEGRDILTGKADVIVCDGFIGNIIIKFGESIPALLKHLLKITAKKSFSDKIKIGLAQGALRKSLKSLDYQEHGGVPLLGVNGISIIGHGSSTEKAIKNMVNRAYEMHRNNLVEKIRNSISKYIRN